MKRLHSAELQKVVDYSRTEKADARRELDELHSKEMTEV
jgi:hypothetical protein